MSEKKSHYGHLKVKLLVQIGCDTNSLKVHSYVIFCLFTPSSFFHLPVAFLFQYVVFIVVGTGLLFMLIFHIGLKEPPRSCTYLFASEGSKRSAGNWKHWFKEIQFYQVSC